MKASEVASNTPKFAYKFMLLKAKRPQIPFGVFQKVSRNARKDWQ